MKYLRIGGKWLLQLALAVLMAGPGTSKFTGPTWERMFRVWGYPDGFYLVIGAVEVVGGICLLIPKLASYSAIVLAVVMAERSRRDRVHVAVTGACGNPLARSPATGRHHGAGTWWRHRDARSVIERRECFGASASGSPSSRPGPFSSLSSPPVVRSPMR